MVRKTCEIMLLWVFIMVLSTLPMNIGATITGTAPPASGDWVINNQTVVTDEIIDLTGSIFVNTGGSLTLDNSTIKIHCSTDGQYGIEVKNGGAICLKNDSIIERSGVGNYYFIVRAGADFEMKNSTIKHCGYENLDYRYTGLYIECDGLIENSVIDISYQGVVIDNATVTVKGTTIQNSYWRNIEARNANLNLENNIICKAAKIGIWAGINCVLTISNNHIHNNTLTGLWIEQNSEVECYENIIEWNGDTEGTHWDSSGHGFAGFDSDVHFHNNTVSYNWGHNFETTRCTATFVDNHFDASRMKCNVEFFDHSDVTAINNYIDGAGHNCFWVRDGVVALIKGNTMKNSPHNGIWAGNGCTLTIIDNIIDTVVEHGIYSYNSTLTIKDNEIKNCGEWGIYTEGCTVTQSGNTFSSVTEGQIYQAYYTSLKIKDKDGAIVEGATVTVMDSSGNDIWTGTTDANGLTQEALLCGLKVDTSGASSTNTYTVKAEKGDMKCSKEFTPDQNITISLEMESQGDDAQDGLDLTLIILLVVIVIVVVLVVAVFVIKGRKKQKQ
ncbi:MAG: right-handed parallel beta-helix repeat-containing protein [Methanomassiliicoccales archaeon]|nr:MAG: right-handed parallel beta-helix repeat-containing protein [Methanomassiliicoccales archaeon]